MNKNQFKNIRNIYFKKALTRIISPRKFNSLQSI